MSPGTSSSSFADDTRIWRGLSNPEDCSKLQLDLESVYSWANDLNMMFNSSKLKWLRYTSGNNPSPMFQYLVPDKTPIPRKDDLRDLGVMICTDLTFNLQIEKTVTTANQMVGWGLRTFRSRSMHLMLVLLKSLVQPHHDFCSQLWSPSKQYKINQLVGGPQLLREDSPAPPQQPGVETRTIPTDLHMEDISGSCLRL